MGMCLGNKVHPLFVFFQKKYPKMYCFQFFIYLCSRNRIYNVFLKSLLLNFFVRKGKHLHI